MTIADHTTPSQKPSWLTRLRGSATPATPPAPDAVARKPLDDMADLLVMSTVDQKVPAEAPGSADVLDALIKSDTADPAATDAAAMEFAEPPPSASEAAALEVSNEQRVSLLQREIETLLRDTPEIADDAPPPAPWPKRALEAIAPMPVGEPPIAIPHEPEPEAQPEPIAPRAQAMSQESAAAAPASVSAAELDVLLEREFTDASGETQAADPMAPAAIAATADVPHAQAQSPAPDATVSAPPVAELPVQPAAAAAAPIADAPATPMENAAASAEAAPAPQSAASISEKIFAEQLDRLMAGAAGGATQAAAAAVPVDDTHDKLTEAEGVLAEELAQLISESAPATAPTPAAAGQATTEAMAPESSGSAIAGDTVSAATVAAPTAAASEGATAATAPTVDAEALALSVEAAPEPPPAPAKGIVAGMRRFSEGLVLMVLQLIDLPFGWISELDKNVIGVAALMLLLGGVVLYVMSRYM